MTPSLTRVTVSPAEEAVASILPFETVPKPSSESRSVEAACVAHVSASAPSSFFCTALPGGEIRTRRALSQCGSTRIDDGGCGGGNGSAVSRRESQEYLCERHRHVPARPRGRRRAARIPLLARACMRIYWRSPSPSCHAVDLNPAGAPRRPDQCPGQARGNLGEAYRLHNG
eukprot:COSAG02_NODE_23682_length_711_cov_1.039216_1_plen_171_part_10